MSPSGTPTDEEEFPSPAGTIQANDGLLGDGTDEEFHDQVEGFQASDQQLRDLMPEIASSVEGSSTLTKCSEDAQQSVKHKWFWTSTKFDAYVVRCSKYHGVPGDREEQVLQRSQSSGSHCVSRDKLLQTSSE